MKFKFYALKLCLACVVVFILQLLIPGFTELFVLDKSAYFEVWRFITAVFLHGSITHLLFNMVALALFGSLLENFIGGKKFLLVFFVSGILANIFAVNFYDSSLGASGAIYGILGALVLIRPMMMVWAFGLPMPMFIAGTLWVAGDVFGIFSPDNVGHLAHLAGMFVGVVFGIVLRRGIPKNNEKERRIYLDEGDVRRWEDSFMR